MTDETQSGGGQSSGSNPGAKVPAEGTRPMGRSGGESQEQATPRVMPENRRPLREGAVPPEERRFMPLDDGGR